MMVHADESSNAQKLKCLSEVCARLSLISEDDEQKRIGMQKQLEKKMAALKVFAEALNRVPEVPNQYVLVRLGDIDVENLALLKDWITHDEATRAHKMLETFRDEAIYERAVRAASSRASSCWQVPGSESVASAKEHLFAKSIGQAFDTSADSDYNEEDEVEFNVGNQARSSLGEHSQENSDICHKISHRQRSRRAKWLASSPRTPSSGSHQS